MYQINDIHAGQQNKCAIISSHPEVLAIEQSSLKDKKLYVKQ